MRKSISRRIVFSISITVVVAVLCDYGWLYLKARSTARSLHERSLIEQAKVISNSLALGENGTTELELPPRLAEAYDNSKAGYRYAVRGPHGNIIFTSGPSVGPLPLFNNRRQTVYDYDPDGSGPLKVSGAAVSTVVGDQTFVTQVEQTGFASDSLSASVAEEFITDGGWLQLPFLLALLGVTVVAVRRAVRPLNDISRLAALIDPTRAGVRLPLDNIPGEISPLVNAINVALEKLDEGLRAQREFNANAAHQLRTPLAVLTANIDAMKDSATAEQLRHDVETMARIVSQLLIVARLETISIATDQLIELNRLATNVAANLAPLALASGQGIEVLHAALPVSISGNEHALTAALSNLVENAITHTPTGTIITVQVTSEPALQVTDTGNGIPVELQDRIFDRFWKADRQSGGAGLGLAIVKRIVTALHGSVTIVQTPSGGASFKLLFPPNRAA